MRVVILLLFFSVASFAEGIPAPTPAPTLPPIPTPSPTPIATPTPVGYPAMDWCRVSGLSAAHNAWKAEHCH